MQLQLPILRLALLCFSLLPLMAVKSGFAEAQVSAFPDLSLPELGTRAESTFQTDPEGAIPFMVEIRGRLTNSMSEENRAIYKENLFLLGLAHMRWFELSGDPTHLLAGIPYWDEFVQDFLSDERHKLAMMNRADSNFGAEQWEQALEQYLHVLSLYKAQLPEAELLGSLARLVQAAQELDRQQEVAKFLWQFLDPTYGEETRLFTLNSLFDRALEVSDLNVLMRLVAEINKQRSFRYNLGVNLRLLSAGDRFEDDEQYLEASLLFSMVLPVEQLLYSVEDRIIELEEILFSGQFIASKKGAFEAELDGLKARRLAIKDAPQYTANLRWRQARVLRLMERTYEAYFAFRRLIDEFPQHKHVEQFIYAAYLQGQECGNLDEAIELGEGYLGEPSYLAYEKPVASRLARLYLKAGAIEKLVLLADEFVMRFPFDPVAAQMAHSLGHAFFANGETERLLETLPYWLEEFPDAQFADTVAYWSGMAYLFEGNFEAANESFGRVIRDFPGSVYFLEARFRQGVARFGESDYASAREIFTQWINDAPEHPLQAEAHVFLGDLDAIDARVDEALANYAKVETLGGSMAFIDHATFESANLLWANRRFDEHNALLEHYLTQYPESPAGAEAVLRLAEGAVERGQISEAFRRFDQGIQQFGNLLESDQVDRLIDASWDTYEQMTNAYEETSVFITRLLDDVEFRNLMLNNRIAQLGYFADQPAIPQELRAALEIRQPLYEALKGAPAKALELSDFPELETVQTGLRSSFKQLPNAGLETHYKSLRADAVDSERAVLALRLLRVLNLRGLIEVSPEELGVAEAELASPATLVWIAGIVAEKDELLARVYLGQVMELAAGQAAEGEALFMLAGLEMESAYFDQAADYYGRFAEEFFGDPRSASAAVFRADALRGARRYDEAIAAYSDVLSQRGWRGEIWAEATFKIGLCFLQMDEEEKAQGFFERTYLAYSGFPEWSGQAVLESASLLQRRGEVDSARRTYEFFLNQPASQDSSIHDRVRAEMNLL